MSDYVDVLIVGAGLSGIAAGYYLQARCPRLSWTILEARDSIGGTWDLFRYPGLRSDSDMYTFGYRFRPWRGDEAIAGGAAILQYIKDTAREFGIDRRIRFRHRVCGLSWSSQTARWTVDLQRGAAAEPAQLRCKFLFMCSGYYRYDQGYAPTWPGMADFQGEILHPQAWRDDADYAGKRVVVIGSGATAVTMIPALAKRAKHVVMLQRSPTYVVSGPSRDAFSLKLRARLPFKLASSLARWRSILRSMYFYSAARSKPALVRANILAGVRAQLGADFDVERHFGPRYQPWDQRLCLAPDGDFFKAIAAGRATVKTDEIERFTEDGILLRSGERLSADLVITATGLVMQLLGDIAIQVDGAPRRLNECLSYKGVMYSGIPNLASAFGYTNASWTLKAELICEYVCRLLRHMERHGCQRCLPRPPESLETQDFLEFSSGYVRRALDGLPRQGKRRPWRAYQNYLKDLVMLRYGRLEDGVLEFS